jgi:hypothetical protein
VVDEVGIVGRNGCLRGVVVAVVGPVMRGVESVVGGGGVDGSEWHWAWSVVEDSTVVGPVGGEGRVRDLCPFCYV